MSARLPLEALDAAHLDATARLHVAARAKQRRDLLRLRGEGWARSHAATRWVRGLQAWVHGVAGLGARGCRLAAQGCRLGAWGCNLLSKGCDHADLFGRDARAAELQQLLDVVDHRRRLVRVEPRGRPAR